MSNKRKRSLSTQVEQENCSAVKQQKLDNNGAHSQMHDFYSTTKFNIEDNEHLWAHQKEAYGKVHEYLRKNRTSSNLLLIVLPTGTGKSGIAHILPFGLKGRVLMITHNTDSCYQLMHNEDFLYRRHVLNEGCKGPKVHVVQNQDDMIHLQEDYSNYDLFIANIHKFDFGGKWKDSIGQFFQLIIIDEGHHIPAKTYNNVVANQLLTNNKVNIVLLTATPKRRDKLPLNATVVFEYSMKQAIEQKLIKHPCLVTYTPENVILHENGVNTVRKTKEVNTHQLKRKINSALLTSKEVRSCLLSMMIKLIEEKRKETQVHHQAIVVCDTQRQVELVTSELNKNYLIRGKPIVAMSYHCELSSTQRLHVQQDMKNSRCDVVVHCGLLNEGHDCPSISITVILCKVKWIGRFSQVVGRSIRYLHDKSLIENTAHIIMNYYLVGKLWEQYKAEAHVSSRPMLSTSLNGYKQPKPAKKHQEQNNLATSTNDERECRLTDIIESNNIEITYKDSSPDSISSAEITPKDWNYDSLLCNTISGKEVIRTTERIVQRKCTSPPFPTTSRDHSKDDPSPPSTTSVTIRNNDELRLLSRVEEHTIPICEHKEKSFGPSCSRCEYLPNNHKTCQHETDILIIQCLTCNKVNKVPLY